MKDIKANLTIGNTPAVRGNLHIGGSAGRTGMAKDYERLKNKPSIENVELVGNKNLEDFGAEPMTTAEVLEIFNMF